LNVDRGRARLTTTARALDVEAESERRPVSSPPSPLRLASSHRIVATAFVTRGARISGAAAAVTAASSECQIRPTSAARSAEVAASAGRYGSSKTDRTPLVVYPSGFKACRRAAAAVRAVACVRAGRRPTRSSRIVAKQLNSIST
jgi:hypothetical protein